MRTFLGTALLLLLTLVAPAQHWQPMPAWAATRRMCTVAFVHEGRGYVGLGHDYNTRYPFDDLGTYDPVRDAWTSEVYLDLPKRTCAFAFVSGNALYIGGGTRDSGRTALRDFYRIRLTDFACDTLALLPMQHANGSRAHAGNGQAYVVGGCDAAGCEAVLWRYDVVTGAWSEADSLYAPAAFGTSFLLGDRLFYGGGSRPGGFVDNSLYAFHCGLRRTERAGELPTPERTMGISAALNDSEAVSGLGFAYNLFARPADPVLRWGGRTPPPKDEADCMLNDLWKYQVRTGTWTRLRRFPDRRRNASAFVLGDRLYIMQGNNLKGTSKGGYWLQMR